MKDIISKSILLTIGVIAINFGFKVYLSYSIEKESLGVFYTMLDIVSIVVLFFSGYKDSIVKAVSNETFQFIYKKVYRHYTLATLLAAGFLYCIYSSQNSRIFDPALLIALFLMMQVSNFYSYLNMAYRNYYSTLFEKTVKAIGLVVSYVVFSLFFSNLTALILAYIMQSLVHILYLNETSRNIFHIRPLSGKKGVYKVFVKQYLLSTAISFSGSITTYLSAIMMFYLFSDKNILAEYQVVAKSVFFALITVFVHPVSAYTFPELSRLVAEKAYDKVRHMDALLIKYLSLFMLVVIFATVFTKTAIGFVFPHAYIDSYKLLNILLPMLPFIVYTSFVVNILKAFDRFDLALYIRLCGVGLFFIAIIIFYMLSLDARSIVYGLDIGFFGMFVLSYFFKRKYLQ